MFEGMPGPEHRRWNTAMGASLFVHVVFFAILLYRPAAVFVIPSDVQLGIPHSSGSQSIVYLAPIGPEQQRSALEESRLTLRAAVAKPHKPKVQPKHEELASTAADAPEETARGGSPFGRVPGSPLALDEVIPAFPVVYPDPPVSRDDLPSGVQGDVVVEVTIDTQGNVVDTKLLQGIGYGIEQKVLSELQRWRFHQATRDGKTNASQHILHFHYPS